MSVLERMQFRALDSNFDATDIIDNYESIIWTEKYSEIGDFEIHGSHNKQLKNIANNASYIFNSATSRLMVIEKTKKEKVDDEEATLTISGRSFESILDRRIILQQVTVLDPADRRFSQIACNLVADAFGSSDPKRYWSMLEVVNDTPQTSLKLGTNVGLVFKVGDNLLEIVKNLCSADDLGFKFEFVYATKKVRFVVYKGTDRSVIS